MVCSTVTGVSSLSPREFDKKVHGCIVMDQVHDTSFIEYNRGVLQANKRIHDLARTKADLYKYSVLLHRVPIVMALDLDSGMDDALNSTRVIIFACFQSFLLIFPHFGGNRAALGGAPRCL